ncbi:MAG TPA: RuBisCO large subunit C-terminal-like domain-containing protein [Chitinispirillaceae bacterium]|nr:RuBisCO large subunit C-terminal-like domain-containing protein [Chitinispirillaceae bacterium]
MTVTISSRSRFEIDYSITCRNGQSIFDYAHEICLEQTVEVPEECLTKDHFDNEIPGKIEKISQIPDSIDNYLVTISFPCDICSYSVPQFLNTIYGNISLKNNIKIISMRIPDELNSVFPGPQFGIEGLRMLLGVFRRPLTCTALKPVGLSAQELASMAAQFANGGVDIIKDDHGITNQPYAFFEERIKRVIDAVHKVNSKTGRKTLYFPMLNDEPEVLSKQISLCSEIGIKGILIAPMLVGCGTVASIRKTTDLAIMTHPSFAGTFFSSSEHGAMHGFLLGTFFRLIGADISIFPNAGGRFRFTQAECNTISDSLRKPFGNRKSSFPAPAGGMRIDRIGEMIEHYGMDAVFIIGGNLLVQGNNLTNTTGMFVETVQKKASEYQLAHAPFQNR